MKRNKLLQISTPDGLYLHGYYVPSESKRVGILHIHGFEGNFYQDNFVHILANELEEKGVGFLTVNTRGNGRDTDFNTVDGKYKRVGARYELLEEAHLDITAWLKCLIDEGYKEIVLMGHSLGTMKAVRYLFEGEYKNKINKLILLSPFDKKGFMVSFGRGDIKGLLNKAQKMVDDGKGEELVTSEFEEGVMSYKTFISWYKQDVLGRMFEFCTHYYDFPILKQIQIPTKIIVGSKDEYFHLSNPEHPEEAMDLLLKHIPNSKGKIINGAVHSFKPHEDIMAKEVSSFVLNNN
ncbi:MAG TPA: alpha/beta hydrolase [Candidatus Bathyarchaeia archaeon]|nr:alpha/beta hydrolase [Candidatus Bathyarchaeia archaeon]